MPCWGCAAPCWAPTVRGAGLKSLRARFVGPWRWVGGDLIRKQRRLCFWVRMELQALSTASFQLPGLSTRKNFLYLRCSLSDIYSLIVLRSSICLLNALLSTWHLVMPFVSGLCLLWGFSWQKCCRICVKVV